MTQTASSRRRSFGRANLIVALIAPLIVSTAASAQTLGYALTTRVN